MTNIFTSEEILKAAEKSCEEVFGIMANLAKQHGTSFPSESNAIGVTATSIGSVLQNLGILQEFDLVVWVDKQVRAYEESQKA